MTSKISNSYQNQRFVLKSYIGFLASLMLGFAYLAIVPPNAGPDEIVHARSSWYLFENPSKIFAKEFIVTSKIPGELVIPDESHEFDNTACFSQRADIPPTCQNLSAQPDQIQRFYIFYHSIPYYLLVGSVQHALSPWLNAYESGKIASFALSWVILFVSLISLNRSLPHLALLIFTVLLTPSCIFLFSSINPSSFEICTAIYLVVTLLKLGQKASRKLDSNFLIAGALLCVSRPLGFIWLLVFLLYFRVMFGFFPIKQIVLLPFLILFIVQVWLGYDWPSPVEFKNPNFEFYIEESVREFNESGHWFAHFFGILAAGEIKIPMLFLYLNFAAILILIMKSASSIQLIRRRQYAVICLGVYFVPAGIQIINSPTWPVWWQGRYTLPAFIGLLMMHFSKSQWMKFRHVVFLALLTHSYLIILTFARFNWGIYPTATPIIVNGWSVSSISFALFLFFFLTYILLIFYLIGIRDYFSKIVKAGIDLVKTT